MKKRLLAFVLSAVVAISATAQSQKAVVIGKQTWAAENLNTDRFANGDLIPETKTNEEWIAANKNKKPAWCYYNNDPANGAKLGRLYNWFAVKDPRGLAPKGWHIPDQDEWEALVYQAGGSSKGWDNMRSSSAWGTERNGTNSTGFNAVPGGMRNSEGIFYKMGDNAYWWTSTPFVTESAGYGMQARYYGTMGPMLYNNDGVAVRCIKD